MTSVGTERTIDSVGANRSTSSSPQRSIGRTHTVLKELPLSIDEFPVEDVTLYAKQIGIDPNSESDLLWIAKKALISNLPDPWIAVEDPKGRLYYYNRERLVSSWEHPSDSYYRSLVEHQKRRTGSSATLSISGLTSIANLQFIDDDMLHNKSDNDINAGEVAFNRKTLPKLESNANKSKLDPKKQLQKKSESEEEVESVEFELDADAAFEEFSFGSDDDNDANDHRDLITLDVTEGGFEDNILYKEVLTIELNANTDTNTAQNNNTIIANSADYDDRNKRKTDTINTINTKIDNKNKIESQTNVQSSSLDSQTSLALNTKQRKTSRFDSNNEVFGNEFSLNTGDDDPFAEFGNNERNANDLFSTANAATTQYNVSKQANNATKSASTHPTSAHIPKTMETVEEASEKDENALDSNETVSAKHQIEIDIQDFNLADDYNGDNGYEDDNDDDEDKPNDFNAVEIEAKFDEITTLLNTEIVSLRNELREEIRKQKHAIDSEIEEQMSDLKGKLNQSQREIRETNSEISAIRQQQHHRSDNSSNESVITTNRKDIERIYKEMQALRSDVTENTSVSIRELRTELTREIKTRANNTVEDLENKFMEFKDETQREMRSIRGDITNVTNNNKTIAAKANELRNELSDAMQDVVERYNNQYSKRLDNISVNYDNEMEKFNNDVKRLESLVTLTENKVRAIEVSGDEIRSLAMKASSVAAVPQHSVGDDCYAKIDLINKHIANLKQQVNDIYNIIDRKNANKALVTTELDELETKNETRVVINESNNVEKSTSVAPIVAQSKYENSADNGLPNRITTLENSVIKICDTLEKFVISPPIVTHRNKTQNSKAALKQETNARNRHRIKISQYSDTDYNNDDDDYLNRTTSSLSSTSLSELRANVPKISHSRRKFKKRSNNPKHTSLAKRPDLYEQHNCCVHNNYYHNRNSDHKNYHPFIKVPVMTNQSWDPSKHKLRDIRASSSSLLNLIKKTTKKLKEEASELESMGKYHFITDFRSTFRNEENADDTAIQKLISVRSDVTDKLKKLTNAINQQKTSNI